MRCLALFCAALGLAAAQASGGYFYLQATLRDGKSVKGYVPEKRASFEGVTAAGQTVTVRLERLPDFAKREWSQEIVWDEKLGLFFLRAPGWTGALQRLWDKLELDPAPPGDTRRPVAERELDATLAEGKKIVVKGSDVAEVKIRYIDPAKEVIKPGKKM